MRRLQITRPSHIKPFIVQKLDDALGTSRGKKYITVTEHDQTVSLAPIKMAIRPKITIVSRVIITYGLPHLFHWKNQPLPESTSAYEKPAHKMRFSQL